MVKILTNVL